ncbi:hypothetical protein WDW37_07420 [Bdellovibrionota bacterium FG-1]
MSENEQFARVNSPDMAKPEKIHLTEIEKPSNVSKLIEVDARPVLIGPVSLIPYRFFMRCPVADGKQDHCPAKALAEKDGASFQCELYDFSIQNKEGAFVHEIKKDDVRIIASYKQKTAFVTAVTLSRSPCKVDEFRYKAQVKEPEVLGVREAVFYPSAKIIERSGTGDSIIDESGNPFRAQTLFSISEGADLLSTASALTIIGRVHPNPKNQVPTIAILETKNVLDDFRNFRLSDEIREQFKMLNEAGLSGVADALSSMTQIYDRQLTHLLILLIFHSVISFRFDGKNIKGTLEGLFIGDAGVGKTMILKTMIQKLRLGQFMTGSCSSRTGLSYAVIQMNGTWEIQWGAFPTNDMGLLIIDEGQDISPFDWEKLSVARSEGVLTVDRAAKGEHPSRTRLIVSANPKDGKQIDSELYPCVHVKQLFTTKDIRRFDLIQSLSTTDVSKEVLVRSERSNDSQCNWLTPEALRNSILFAWSRKPDQIRFAEGISSIISRCAGALFEKYGTATDIPVVTSDIRDKVLRLSVAYATANHRTDDSGEVVVVTEEDVKSVLNLLNTIYSNGNFGLDSYAAMMTDESNLTDDEFNLIKEELLPGDLICLGIRNRNAELISLFIRNPEMTGNDISNVIDMDRKIVCSYMEPLKKHGLITAKRGAGYTATRKFNKFLLKLKALGYHLGPLTAAAYATR